MKERFPALMALILLIVLVLSTWWAAKFAQTAIQTDPPRRMTHEMDSWSKNFVMLRTDAAGKPVNRLEGDYGEHFPDDDSYHVTNPRAIGQRAGDPITVGTSKTAILDDHNNRITMIGDAHVHRPADAKNGALDAYSQKFVILPNDDVVYTDLPAHVVKGQSTMDGVGMRYNNKTQQLEVYSASNVNLAPADTNKASSRPANNDPAGGGAANPLPEKK
ncbi:LPS export ABC transporter periplasmic protein LptC [Bordetella sp. FB-8]|uniref:LPS export ABC transporter periplasmic protein LptC n=1 Tax=Bordetella sp. FB-8 TaxID=1159870 RepID=UPI000368F348|nr:LPS export ABC transporter periplasmic protein LptC [Bordetella sp. FB-8]